MPNELVASILRNTIHDPSGKHDLEFNCRIRNAPNCLLVVLTLIFSSESARGNDSTPGTLFQWSYGTSFSGGPNLNEPLVTDRPDFTEASVTVGKGVAQIEFGYTLTFDRSSDETIHSHSYGEPLLRYGIIANWLECRFALFPSKVTYQSGGKAITDFGTEDLYTGFKIALTPQETIFPEMALIPQMNLPTGSHSFTSNRFEPGLNWIYAWEVSDFLSLAGSTQGNRRFDGMTGAAYLEMAQSWAVGYSLTEKLGAYSEWYALVPSGADSARTQHYVDGGFTYLINNNLQFDIRAGIGLSRASDDCFIGTGLSIRFF